MLRKWRYKLQVYYYYHYHIYAVDSAERQRMKSFKYTRMRYFIRDLDCHCHQNIKRYDALINCLSKWILFLSVKHANK